MYWRSIFNSVFSVISFERFCVKNQAFFSGLNFPLSKKTTNKINYHFFPLTGGKGPICFFSIWFIFIFLLYQILSERATFQVPLEYQSLPLCLYSWWRKQKMQSFLTLKSLFRWKYNFAWYSFKKATSNIFFSKSRSKSLNIIGILHIKHICFSFFFFPTMTIIPSIITNMW